MKAIIITGGAGFIGSHVVRLMVRKYPNYRIINVDALTYAGNLANLKDIENEPNYMFVKADICDREAVYKLVEEEHPDVVVNFAAESHVDRSIENPFEFATTNVLGTLSMLQAARTYWESLPERYEGKKFYHVSTDEVYGALDIDYSRTVQPFGLHKFSESYKYDPHSPYSASKASSDHFVRAYKDTYGMPTVISNCSNNYGPYQFPEKLIPLMISNAWEDKKLPVYGDGKNIRDWLHVLDHCRAIDLVMHEGKLGEVYNIGGNNEKENIYIVKLILEELGKDESLIEFVTDRLGHDRRYAIDSTKI